MRVLITGASRGIGRAIAEEYRAHGYEVVAPARVEMDLSDSASVERYIEAHYKEPLDALINNAGINDVARIDEVDDETILRMMSVDLVAPIRLLRGFAAALKNSPCGRVVNIGSIWAAVSKPGRGLYSAAKNGIHGVTNALALELAADGVLVNTVCPGFTATELTVQNNGPQEIEAIEGDIPLGRLATPEEIAHAVYWLGSSENTYITGQKILVDGGFTAR